jgi:hypothetical protein
MAVYSFCFEHGTRGFDSRRLHMATRKVTKDEPIGVTMARHREEFLKKHPEIDTRFYVIEVKPPSEDDYGGYVSGSSKRVSEYFPTVEEAQQWEEAFDPDRGNHFAIQQEFLREYTERRWTTY